MQSVKWLDIHVENDFCSHSGSIFFVLSGNTYSFNYCCLSSCHIFFPPLTKCVGAGVFFLFVCLEPLMQHTEVSRSLQAYTTATATWDLSHICNLHNSGRHLIFNPLSKARDRNCVLMDILVRFLTTEPRRELFFFLHICNWFVKCKVRTKINFFISIDMQSTQCYLLKRPSLPLQPHCRGALSKIRWPYICIYIYTHTHTHTHTSILGLFILFYWSVYFASVSYCLNDQSTSYHMNKFKKKNTGSSRCGAVVNESD